MEFAKDILKKNITKRIIVFAILGLILFLSRSMINMFLLTFIFTYLIYSAQSFIIIKLKKIIHVKQKVVIAVIYLVIVAVVILVAVKYMPVMYRESRELFNQANDLYNKNFDSLFKKYGGILPKDFQIKDYVGSGMTIVFNSIKSVGQWGYNILISLVLSLFFLLERNKIARFTSKFKTSKIAFVYNELYYFGQKFLHSFGKVIQAQIAISFINSIISIIALGIMGFPQVFGLGVLIFILGLIPVAGVFISLVPLTMIAFSIGGPIKVLYVLIMIVVLHALESYILNPKLMSQKTELPIFYTFMILLVSEHFMGIWGLIIGIPIFMFILDVLDVNRSELPQKITNASE